MRYLLTPFTAALVVGAAVAGGLAYAQGGGTATPGTSGGTTTQAPTPGTGGGMGNGTTGTTSPASPSSPPATTPSDPSSAGDASRMDGNSSGGTLAAQADRN